MKRLAHAGTNERGSVAVEMAIVLITILFPLLVGALFFGRFFWHYTVAEKAAHDAARFFASASVTEMKVQGLSGDPAIVDAVKALAQAEVAELKPSLRYRPTVSVFCDGGPCDPFGTAPLPRTVSVRVAMSVEDPFFSAFSSAFSGNEAPLAIQINATGNSAYVGN